MILAKTKHIWKCRRMEGSQPPKFPWEPGTVGRGLRSLPDTHSHPQGWVQWAQVQPARFAFKYAQAEQGARWYAAPKNFTVNVNFQTSVSKIHAKVTAEFKLAILCRARRKEGYGGGKCICIFYFGANLLTVTWLRYTPWWRSENVAVLVF